jgi:hypothetical protein
MQYGILSRNEAMKKLLISTDFSDKQIQNRRDKIIKLRNIHSKSQHGESQHDLVNLFFNPLNPTLSVSQRDYGHENLIIFCINFLSILNDDTLSIAFTDKNASISEANLHVFNDIEDIDKLDLNLIYGEYMKDRSREDWKNWKQKRSAEFMVYPSISNKYIYKVITTSTETKSYLEGEINSQMLKLETFKDILVDDRMNIYKPDN